MKRPMIGRRRVLMGASSVVGLLLAGRARAQAARRIRLYWWGSKERADLTLRAVALFKAQNANLTVDAETLGWGDYWPRLATQAAGRNMPDLIQMDYRYIFEYARRGGLLPLDAYLGNALDIADFGAAATDCGRVDGKLYGINLGMNSSAVLYAQEIFSGAGIKPPTHETTWTEFAAAAAALTKTAGREGFYGSADGGGVEPAFEGWLRLRGKNLYDGDEKLGFTAEDAADWLGLWDGMRKTRACVPAAVQALDKLTPETSMLSLDKAAVGFAHSNQLVAYQALTRQKLGMSMYPTNGPGSKPGHYLKPSQLFSVAATSRQIPDTLKLLNFFVAVPEGAKAIGAERGVPASAAMRAAIAPGLDELGRMMVDYISFVSDKVGALPPPPPKGAGEIALLLTRVNEEVGFGKIKVADAGGRFVTEAKSILERG